MSYGRGDSRINFQEQRLWKHSVDTSRFRLYTKILDSNNLNLKGNSSYLKCNSSSKSKCKDSKYRCSYKDSSRFNWRRKNKDKGKCKCTQCNNYKSLRPFRIVKAKWWEVLPVLSTQTTIIRMQSFTIQLLNMLTHWMCHKLQYGPRSLQLQTSGRVMLLLLATLYSPTSVLWGNLVPSLQFLKRKISHA